MFNMNRNRKDDDRGNPLVSFSEPQSIYAEQFRNLRTNIDFVLFDTDLSSLLVTSSIPSEGKSTVAANLAYVIGQTDRNVLIVDADLRKPTLHKTYRLSNETGLSTLLSKPDLRFNQIVQRSRELGLYFLPSGPVPPNPAELLGSNRMNALMAELEKNFDVIIYDAPPVNSVTDPLILANKVDGVLLVARQGYVKRDEVRKSVESLRKLDSNILGFVLNGVPAEKENSYYAYN
ncbi:CpsD/CapB family tyrosine-protein kinase [Fundicoccus culcitae]|uniref:CpsD/CapB family tyrosine-protein kinase n=1 Tax=Fundicoccus culcitae TaxID=2969821 RepID=A0ABY5P935_9LACT|nr:CpsD/CapB family tyrosine-protein kinase [Fundicoccus culcitae]UUX35258.1 CpsD/CapB family tyrosine-protein kinase [Fundicoccus culcitae]